jgi:hypothetical protein
MPKIDAYFGNQANFSLSRWNNLLPLVANYGGLFSKEMFAEERVNTYNKAIETNPEVSCVHQLFSVEISHPVCSFKRISDG